MKITVVGTGNVGRSIGVKWAEAGHSVVFGYRTRNERVEQAVVESGGRATAVSLKEAIQEAAVVLLAIPGAAVGDFLAEHGTALNGKTVIDATNRLGTETLHNFDAIRTAAPNASLVRAFNTLGWEMFSKPVVDGERAALFYCCEADTRKDAEQLIADVGLQPVYIGDNGQVALIDSLTGVWFALAFGQQMGRRVALRLLHEA